MNIRGLLNSSPADMFYRMGDDKTAELIVGPAPPELRRAAIALALTTPHGPPPEILIDRAVAEAESDGEIWPGLLIARAGPSLVGATWVRFLPGNVAAVSEPRAETRAPGHTLLALASSAAEAMRTRNVTLGQALIEDAASPAGAALQQAGFRHGGDLLYLAWAASRELVEAQDEGIAFVEYAPGAEDRFARIVERTYVDTRDCPELNGVRRIEDVLAGYRATGVFSPARWLAITRDGQDVGCLLLADHPDDDQWELVYLGIVPEARGLGLGLAATRHAQAMTARAGRGRLVLAVDSRNAPALAIYAQANFDTWFRRAIFLATFDKQREI